MKLVAVLTIQKAKSGGEFLSRAKIVSCGNSGKSQTRRMFSREFA
jgi:hypothetical protein